MLRRICSLSRSFNRGPSRDAAFPSLFSINFVDGANLALAIHATMQLLRLQGFVAVKYTFSAANLCLQLAANLCLQLLRTYQSMPQVQSCSCKMFAAAKAGSSFAMIKSTLQRQCDSRFLKAAKSCSKFADRKSDIRCQYLKFGLLPLQNIGRCKTGGQLCHRKADIIIAKPISVFADLQPQTDLQSWANVHFATTNKYLQM